jgi:hypothetical protein
LALRKTPARGEHSLNLLARCAPLYNS